MGKIGWATDRIMRLFVCFDSGIFHFSLVILVFVLFFSRTADITMSIAKGGKD